MIKNRRTDLMQALKRSANPKVIWGAGHVGAQIYTACQQAGIEITAFCDRNPEIIGKTIFGIKVLHTNDIPVLYPHAEMILSMNRITEAVDELKSLNLAQWYAGGLLFDLNKVLQNPPNAYAVPDDHYALQICSIVHNNFVEEEACLLGSLDCVITERCSLKCRECSNLMQYYAHPIDYDIQQVIVELQALMQYVDRLFELRLIGGDVFMHRHWDIILQFALSEPKIDRITFYTNGTLIPRLEKLSLLSNERVMLQISNYGKRSYNLAKLIEQCKKNRIWYRATPIDMWNACSTISRHYRSSDESESAANKNIPLLTFIICIPYRSCFKGSQKWCMTGKHTKFTQGTRSYHNLRIIADHRLFRRYYFSMNIFRHLFKSHIVGLYGVII